ncbi:MAG: hypothetical protein LBI48_10190 [Burkholderiaceae bacterium]|jgi:YD repeat-containing protein|nr:hypothetical protein [Burkholderiaceae bacterium]
MPSRLALPKRILWLVCLWLLCLAAPMQAQGSIITGDQLTRIEQLGADNQTIVLAYDSQGNLIEKQSGAQTTSYQWDANDRLTSVSQDGTLLGQYRNNAQGLRVEKHASDPLHPGAPPQKTTWLWDQDTPIQESNAAATVVARYEFAGREPIGLLHAQDGAQSLHPDGLGSIVLTTDTGGNIHRETIFDAWGNTIAESGPPANRLGYTGHQMDQESGLIYMQARY